MANHIAAQFRHLPAGEAAAAVAAHLGRFWDPGMRGRLYHLVDADAHGLDPLVADAVRLMRG